MSAGSALLLDLRKAGATVRLTAGPVSPELRLRGASTALLDRVRACKPELLVLLAIPTSDLQPTPEPPAYASYDPYPNCPKLLFIDTPLAPWHEGVTRLQAMPILTGFAPARWARACLDAAGLLDRHGAELLALGWTAADVFGLHPDAPGAAVDCYGLTMPLDGGTLAELTAATRRELFFGAGLGVRVGPRSIPALTKPSQHQPN